MKVGKGPLMDSIREEVKGLGLADKVIFTGGRSNVKDYYANMDVLVFPSKYEGLPGTIVEAQSSLVPCLISDVITKDVAVTALVKYESLSEEPVKWAKDAIKLYDCTRDITIEQASQALKERGFDVTSQVGKLKRIYEKLVM
jgi:glycosyltransferase involved in cell wall biosynthesis